MPITHQNMPHCWLVRDDSQNPPLYSFYYAVEFYGFTPSFALAIPDSTPIYNLANVQVKLDTTAGGGLRQVFGLAKGPHTKPTGNDPKIKLSIYGPVQGVIQELGRCIIDYDDADPAGGGGGGLYP